MPARPLLRPAVAVATALAFTLPAATANGAALRPLGSAVVKTVDGPGQLTIAVGRRTLPVRLFDVELPQAGECGAAETTAALGGFVRRAPRKLSYSLVRTRSGPERDAAGRLLAVLAYPGRGLASRDLGDDLVRAGWGRYGEAASGDATRPVHGRLPSGADRANGGDAGTPPTGRVGIWARCGGRFHLPVAEPVPASSAAVWNVDELGVAHAIGPLTLSATLTPATSLTLGRLAETAPVEFSHGPFGCIASIPSLQLQAWSSIPSAPCAQAPVLLLQTAGPDPARLSRGGGVGLPFTQAQAGYPSLSGDSPAGWLSGGRRQWAWQTAVDTTEQDEPVVTDLLAYQEALLPDD